METRETTSPLPPQKTAQAASEGRRIFMLVATYVAIGVIALVVAAPWGREHALSDAAMGFLIGIGGMFARSIGTAFDFEFGSSRESESRSPQR